MLMKEIPSAVFSGTSFAQCIWQLASDLSIVSCLLRVGWIPVSEQYAHASLGFVKHFTSSLFAHGAGNNIAFHNYQTVVKATHRLKTGPQRARQRSMFLPSFSVQILLLLTGDFFPFPMGVKQSEKILHGVIELLVYPDFF